MFSDVPSSSNRDQKAPNEQYNHWWQRIAKTPKELKIAPSHLIDYNMCLMAVRKYGFAIEFVPKEILDVRLIVYALKRDGVVLDLVPMYLRTKQICIVACETDSRALRSVPPQVLDDVALMILKKDGHALKYIKKFATEEMIRIAVENEPLALQHVPKPFQNYELAKSAVSRNGDALQFVNHDLFTDELIELALDNDRFGWVGQCLPKTWYMKYRERIKLLDMGVDEFLLPTVNNK